MNNIAGFETKYEATYALDGAPYAMKCMAMRAERDNGEVHGPVLITVYHARPTAAAAAAFAATQGTTQTNCRVQLKELCDRFGAALAFSDATPAPGGGFACDVSVGNAHVGRGVGPRKALAKENAAENALRALAGGSH